MSAERLYEQSLESIKAALPPAEQLLLIWVLREHSLEADMLREQINILKPIVDRYEAELSARSDLLVQRADELQRKSELLDEEEAKRQVNEMLDKLEANRAIAESEMTVAEAIELNRRLEETVAPSDTSGEHVDEEPAESTDERPKNWMQKNPIGPLQPAPIVTVEPEPYKPEGPVSEAEKERIKRLIGVQNTGLTGEQFCTVVSMRLKNATATQIADATGVSFIGPQLRAADRHVKQLAIHPREEWREEYLRQLALACQRRNA